MAPVALLEKARQRRIDALASLGTRHNDASDDRMISIFDGIFDDDLRLRKAITANVVPFRSQRVARAATGAERIAA